MPVHHSVLILNGPNLNLLGSREPAIYGRATLADVERACLDQAGDLGLSVTFRQSNHEGQLIDWIHDARGHHQGIIVNAGALTHTSLALHDALKGVALPAIEVHLSNVHAREPFRHHTMIGAAVNGVIAGFGLMSYLLALQAIKSILEGD